MLVDLQPQDIAQSAFDLDEPAQAGAKSGATLAFERAKLMTAFDAVNQRFGRGSLQRPEQAYPARKQLGGCVRTDARLDTPRRVPTCQWPGREAARNAFDFHPAPPGLYPLPVNVGYHVPNRWQGELQCDVPTPRSVKRAC